MLQPLKYAFNSLKKNKVYTFLNIIGLSLGMGVAMALTFTVIDLLNIDQFHQNKDTVFKLAYREDSTSAACFDACSALLAPAVLEKIPEVVDYCQFIWANDVILGSPENHVKENGYYVDKGWFSMLSFPLMYGDLHNVLSKPENIVLSQKLSKKLFGAGNPVGRNIHLYSYESEKPEILTVSGVFRDIRLESSLKFEFVQPYAHFLNQHPYAKSWGNIGTRSYIQVRKGTDLRLLSEKITHLARNMSPETDGKKAYLLAPLNKSNNNIYRLSGEPSFGYYLIIALALIGLSILIISIVNYVNLSIAHSVQRAKEISIRKITGAGRKDLIVQFVTETFLLVLTAGLMAVVIQNKLLNIFLSNSQPLVLGRTLLIVFWVLLLLVALITAWYPSLYMSKFSPLMLQKNSQSGGSGVKFSRKFSVSFQFFSAIVLMTTAVILSGQVNFMFKKSMGMDRYNVVYFTKNRQLGAHWDAFAQELSKKPGIQSVTLSDQLPFRVGNTTTSIYWEGKAPLNEEWYFQIQAGSRFLHALKMDLIDGRDFVTGDAGKVIINEAAAKKMNMQHPVGSRINMQGVDTEIVGMVKDFNFMFMEKPDQPLYIRFDPESSIMALIRLSEGETTTGLKSLQEVYAHFSPDFVLDYAFLDQAFNEQYRMMKKMRDVVLMAAFLAVVIACLGLLGLTVYATERRVKEMGVRRINGATVFDLLGLLSGEMFSSILLAALAANPLIYLLNKTILEGFPERMEIGVTHFVWSFVILFGMVGLFVGGQIARVVIRNPVEALKYE